MSELLGFVIRPVTTFIRTLVSGDKRRFRDGRYDLDLSYITDRIMGMAIPATGIASLWRNPASELAAFLNEYHPKSYRIFNLSTLPYDTSYFDADSVVDLGFPDHHNPPLLLLHRLCQEIDKYLSLDSSNVVLIHCLAGRGRTGTVIASYLTYSGEFDSGSEALEHFAQRRSYVNKGVTQPSQRRYVQYYSELICNRRPSHIPVKLMRVVLYSLPRVSKGKQGTIAVPQIDIFTAPAQSAEPTLLFRSSLQHSVIGSASADVPIQLALPQVTDIYIRCYHVVDSSKPGKDGAGKRKFLFRLGFNTGFLPLGVLRLTKSEIDDAIKSSKFDADFFIDIVCDRMDGKEDLKNGEDPLRTIQKRDRR
eukprot:ANDGO_06539.mRNA.1 Phosphatidylinositol 3